MRFTVADEDLSLWLELDEEPDHLDLTQNGLGEALLDAAVDGMLASHAQKQSPDGRPWAPNAPSTARQKGHAEVGVRSGALLDPETWHAGDRQLDARRVGWIHPHADDRTLRGKVQGFHHGNPRTGQPARPLIGWTRAAQARAVALIQDALQR